MLTKQDVQMGRAVSLHRQGRLREAKEIYEKLLNVSSRNAGALHLLGVVFNQTKNHKAAVDLTGETIEINPCNPATYSNLGNAFLDLRRLEIALSSYDKAISLKPDYADAQAAEVEAKDGT